MSVKSGISSNMLQCAAHGAERCPGFPVRRRSRECWVSVWGAQQWTLSCVSCALVLYCVLRLKTSLRSGLLHGTATRHGLVTAALFSVRRVCAASELTLCFLLQRQSCSWFHLGHFICLQCIYTIPYCIFLFPECSNLILYHFYEMKLTTRLQFCLIYLHTLLTCKSLSVGVCILT